MKKYLFIMSAAAIVAACAQEELPENGNKPAGEAVCYVSASTCDTKAYLAEKSDGVYKVLWAPEDKVSVNGNESVSADLTEDKSSATFGFSTELSDPVDMVYPSSVVTGYSEGVAQVRLPASQRYVSGSFDPASGLVFGSGTKAGGVTLDHAMAYMKVVPAIASDHEGHNIASFSITTAGEAVSGDFTLDFAEKTLTAATEGTGSSVTVKCDESGVASGNGIIIAIPAKTYAAGMKMTLTDTQGCTYTATSSRELEAVAGTVYTTELAFDPLLVEENYYDFTVPANVKSPEATGGGNSAITVVYSDDTQFAISNGRYNVKNENDDKSYYLVISGNGSYISLPAVEGKRLASVRMMTSGSTRYMAIASDAEGTLVTGGDMHTYTGSGELADHTWELSGTKANTQYYGIIPSSCDSKATMTIRKMWLTYEEVELAAPANLSADKTYYSETTLSWDPAAGASGYNVYVNGEKYNDSPLTETTCHITGLDVNTDYTLEVASFCKNVELRSSPVSVRTKNVWIVNKGRTNVCVQWDDISTGTAADGMDKGYMIEVLKADKTTSVFGEMFCGQNVISSTAPSSAFSSTDRLGKTNGVNHFPQMRVGIGLLDPATTYYVRVRSLDGFSSTISATLELNNSAGNSEWSSLVKFTTDPAHVAGAKEVIWTGFDECGVLPDYKNMCAGLAPMLTSGKSTAVFATDKSQYQWGFYPFQSAGHRTSTLGYSASGKYVDGEDNHRDKPNYVLNKGSMNGWCVSTSVKPGVGVLLMNAESNVGFSTTTLYLGTPALSANLPEDVEVSCKVTVVAGFYPYGPGEVTKNPYFVPYKWNGLEHVKIGSTLYYVGGAPTSSYVDADNYTTEIHTQTNVFYVDLKKGDNVKFHVNNTNVFFDEILIEVVE